jgi:hypothetical protein
MSATYSPLVVVKDLQRLRKEELADLRCAARKEKLAKTGGSAGGLIISRLSMVWTEEKGNIVIRFGEGGSIECLSAWHITDDGNDSPAPWTLHGPDGYAKPVAGLDSLLSLLRPILEAEP